jgi:3D (Asp-Asp-Asp) domain-containing protein
MLNKVKTMIVIAVAVLFGIVSANVQAATITVKKGDTLWGLSRVHKTTLKNIKKWNHLTSNHIYPGEKLTISVSPSTHSIEKHYIVKHRDTLRGITRNHHVVLEKHKIHARTNKAHAKVRARVEAAFTTIPSSRRAITVTATAYTASCAGCSGITATGMNIKDNPNARVIAVDPSVIPLESKVYIKGYGEYTAADTGGAIKGNRIDVFIPSEQAALNFGRKQLRVTILN